MVMLLAITTFISCNKEKKWESTASLTSKTYHTAAIAVRYDIKGAKEDIEVGICWDDESNPNLNDGSISQAITSSETVDFDISKLYANTTYYFKPFIYTEGGGALKYGEEISMTTDGLPALADCTPTSGVVELGGTAFSTDNMTTVLLPDYYKVNMSNAAFDFNFHFKNEPQSGIYLHDSSPQYLQDFQYYMSVQVIDGGANCTYYGTVDQPIHVNNTGGVISLSFCELEITTSGGCAPTQLLSGEMVAQ
jgi:hypothetical protein